MALACGSASTISTLPPGSGQVGAQVDGGGRLAHPAFLIGQSIDTRHA